MSGRVTLEIPSDIKLAELAHALSPLGLNVEEIEEGHFKATSIDFTKEVACKNCLQPSGDMKFCKQCSQQGAY